MNDNINPNELQIIYQETTPILHWDWAPAERVFQYGNMEYFGLETVRRVEHDYLYIEIKYLPCEYLGIIDIRLPDGAGWIADSLDAAGHQLYQVLSRSYTYSRLIRHGIAQFDQIAQAVNQLSPCPPDWEGKTRERPDQGMPDSEDAAS